MSLLRLLPVALGSLVFSTFLQAQSEPPAADEPAMALSEADKARIIEKSEQLRKDFERLQREVIASAITRFEGASSSEGSAVEFYLACQKIIHDRTPDIDPSDDKEQAKAAQARVKQQIEAYQEAPGRAAALQMQLAYLVMVLQSPTVKDTGTMVSRVRDMVAKVMNVVKLYTAPNVDPIVKKVPVATAGKGGKGKGPSPSQQHTREEQRARRQITQTLRQGVMGTVFAEAYNLRSYFKQSSGLSDSPLDLQGIYGGYILPWYRQNKRGDLNMVWDEYLGHEAALHRCEQEDFEFSRWGITGYRNLQWKKWMDLLKYGNNKALALDELAKMVKENPSHPDLQNWMEEMTTLAESLNAAPPPAPVEPPPTDPAK